MLTSSRLYWQTLREEDLLDGGWEFHGSCGTVSRYLREQGPYLRVQVMWDEKWVIRWRRLWLRGIDFHWERKCGFCRPFVSEERSGR